MAEGGDDTAFKKSSNTMAEGRDDESQIEPVIVTSDELKDERCKFLSLGVFQEPLCLIKNEEDGTFSIDEEVLSQIKQIDQTVNVIAITGPYRTGKSYLMNRLARDKHGFTLGNGVDAKTKGVWVWCLIHPVYTDQVMVLLDTEGIGDVDKVNSDNDYMLLCITTLISSTFIYNVKGVIDKDTLDKLGFVTYYARKVSGSGDKRLNAYSSDIGLYFPRFVLCLRDFSHDLGEETPNDYLERLLTLKEDDGQDRYNQIRACIRKFFLKRACFVFDTPVAGRKNLSQLEGMGEKDLLLSFIEDSDTFVETVNKYQPMKLLDGKRINGNMFSSLLKTYVTTFNSGQIPCIDSAMITMARQENMVVLKNVKEKFKDQFCSVELPVYDEKRFLELFKEERRKAYSEFRSKCVLEIEEALYDKIEKDFDKIWTAQCCKNIQKQKSLCISAMEIMYGSEIKPKLNEGHYCDVDGYQRYLNDFENLKLTIKGKFQEMDDTLFKASLTEFRDKRLEDDMLVMQMTDKSKKEMKDEHKREMNKIEEDFRSQLREEHNKYITLIDDSKKQRAVDEENNKRRIQETVNKWEGENAKILEQFQKEQKLVEELLSMWETDIKDSAPSTVRGLTNLVPIFGPIINFAVDKMKHQKREQKLQNKKKKFGELKGNGETGPASDSIEKK